MGPILSPHLQETTQSLIDNLLASEAFVCYGQAHSRLNTDSAACALLKDLSQAQSRLRKSQADNSVAQADVDALRELQRKVQRNQVVINYSQSQQEAISFLREINGEISQLLGINFATFANRSTC